MKNPPFLKPFFWDVDYEHLHPKDRPRYVIARLLDIGDEKAVKWLKNFSEGEIKEVVRTTRALSKKSANFWRLFFDLREDEVRCLRKDFQRLQRAIWRY